MEAIKIPLFITGVGNGFSQANYGLKVRSFRRAIADAVSDNGNFVINSHFLSLNESGRSVEKKEEPKVYIWGEDNVEFNHFHFRPQSLENILHGIASNNLRQHFFLFQETVIRKIDGFGRIGNEDISITDFSYSDRCTLGLALFSRRYEINGVSSMENRPWSYLIKKEYIKTKDQVKSMSHRGGNSGKREAVGKFLRTNPAEEYIFNDSFSHLSLLPEKHWIINEDLVASWQNLDELLCL